MYKHLTFVYRCDLYPVAMFFLAVMILHGLADISGVRFIYKQITDLLQTWIV